MSEQSGPITREQVERAIAKPRNINYRELPLWWREWAPDYVIAAAAADDWDAERAALTRWRDELAAAEPVRRVARWDAARGAYVALDAHGAVCMITPDRETAIGWGYDVAPAEDSPERLRERREALGWTTAYAGHWVPWFDHTDVERAECGRGVPAFVARYAAALSAEEARLAEEERLACAYRESDGTLVWDDSPLPEPERPAPRFKVGDWVRVTNVAQGGDMGCIGVEFRILSVFVSDGRDIYVSHKHGTWEASHLEPASPPAPEVVDVPQPLVKRFGGVEASWGPGEDHVTLVEPARGVGLPAPLALLRAMLAAIDAQQGGAS